MIKRANERVRGKSEHFKDGIGYVLTNPMIDSPEELWGKGRLFSHNTLEKDCEIGWHVHSGDGEIYYILTGEGEYNDNGETVTVHAGDVTFTPAGEGHALVNRKDEPLELIALILYM